MRFDRGLCDSLAIRFHVYTLVPKYIIIAIFVVYSESFLRVCFSAAVR